MTSTSSGPRSVLAIHDRRAELSEEAAGGAVEEREAGRFDLRRGPRLPRWCVLLARSRGGGCQQPERARRRVLDVEGGVAAKLRHAGARREVRGALRLQEGNHR